eukprot:gene16565-biopygen8873
MSHPGLAAGLCARCGNYVFGGLGASRATSNRRSGPPRDVDGKQCGATAQPPFLLRWSPDAFARFCPSHFTYDASTNRLRLRDGKVEPWLLRAGEHVRLCSSPKTPDPKKLDHSIPKAFN